VSDFKIPKTNKSKAVRFTCYGKRGGWCGMLHSTIEFAQDCIERHMQKCSVLRKCKGKSTMSADRIVYKVPPGQNSLLPISPVENEYGFGRW